MMISVIMICFLAADEENTYDPFPPSAFKDSEFVIFLLWLFVPLMKYSSAYELYCMITFCADSS